MKITMTTIILVLTITSTALIAGLYYSYSCSVNIGLNKLSNKEYVSAMQAINEAILNPTFFATFVGTLILLPISTYLSFTTWQSPRFIFMLLATCAYALGSFGVTIFGNVPLNEALASIDLKTASIQEINLVRANFENSWNSLHGIRTIASITSLILIIIAAVTPFNEIND